MTGTWTAPEAGWYQFGDGWPPRKLTDKEALAAEFRAFCEARLAEDQAAIDTRERDNGQCDYLRGVHLEPEGALREVEVKRQILAGHATIPSWLPPSCQSCFELNDQNERMPAISPCRTARLVASSWGDHPDYRQEWAP